MDSDFASAMKTLFFSWPLYPNPNLRKGWKSVSLAWWCIEEESKLYYSVFCYYLYSALIHLCNGVSRKLEPEIAIKLLNHCLKRLEISKLILKLKPPVQPCSIDLEISYGAFSRIRSKSKPVYAVLPCCIVMYLNSNSHVVFLFFKSINLLY